MFIYSITKLASQIWAESQNLAILISCMTNRQKISSKATLEIKAKSALAAKGAESFFQEFTQFIARGNIIELAVGLTVGAAFTKVVTSLVNNLLMPLIGIFLKGESFRDLYISLDGVNYPTLVEAETAGAALIKYGQLIADLLDFLIIALVIFLVIRFVTKFRWKKKVAEEAKEIANV
jgi:large conductance mechanosensitive channel